MFRSSTGTVSPGSRPASAAATSPIRTPTPPRSGAWPNGATRTASRSRCSRTLLSAYALEDLLLQETLLERVEAALLALVEASRGLMPVLVIGAPLRHRNRIYNTAAVIHRGRLLGWCRRATCRTTASSTRSATSPPAPRHRETIRLGGTDAPFGTDLLFPAEDLPGLVLGVEICEDMWIPVPPSSLAALAGATVLANLSGSPITIGRAESRTLLCRSASARCLAAYIYAAAGPGESTTDLSWTARPRSTRMARCWPRARASPPSRR